MANKSTNPANSQVPSTDKDRANHMTEWGRVRDTMQFFDDKSHDLRKYGFSFITALLTAEGILIPMEKVIVPAQIKFAVFGVTLLLILALHLIDKNYRVYQRAANMRASVLENELNLEVSETISDKYKAEHIGVSVILVYIFFIIGVLLLGWFSLSPEWIYFLYLSLIAFIGIILTIFGLGLSFKYKYLEDWTISTLECNKEGRVRITLTNFNKAMSAEAIRKKIKKDFNDKFSELFSEDFQNKFEEKLTILHANKMKIRYPIFFKDTQLVFDIINEETGEKCLPQTAKKDMDIYDSQSWILKRSNFGESGVYQILPRFWPLPLHRRIIVCDNIVEKKERVKPPSSRTNK